MANKVQVKRSAVAGKIPTTTDLDLGELAINTYDGKLFMKKNVGGTETIVDITAASTGDVKGPATSTANAIARFDGTLGKTIKNSKAQILDSGAFYNYTGTDAGGNRVYTSVLRLGDQSGAGGSAFITTTGSVQNVHLRAEVDNPLGTNYTELRIQSDGEMRWSGGNNGKMFIDSGGIIRFSAAGGLYQSALFGPRVGSVDTCSVIFAYDSSLANFHKFDSNADGLSVWDNSNVLANFRRGTGNLELRGSYRGSGSFITTFTASIDANANREPGVWGSYASSAINAPDNSGILWNGMSGNGPSGNYLGVADGGQLWQNYSNGGFYTRKRWGGSFGAWTYIGG